MTRALSHGALLGLVGLVLLVAPAAHASFPGANGRIYFQSDRGGMGSQGDIWSFNPDGSDPQPVIAGPMDDFEPAVSADGRQIVWVNDDRDGTDYDIFAANIDGSNLRQLTKNNGIDDFYPSWSPDGTRIAFESNRDDALDEIYTMRATDGGDVRRLTNNSVADDEPTWSPDGTKIAYVSPGTSGTDIWVVPATGGAPVDLTNSASVSEQHPDWSPDGTKFAYDAGSNVFTVSANGTGAAPVAQSSDVEQRPAWSPDGSHIAYSRELAANSNTDQVFVAGADASNPTNLSNTPAGVEDFDPSWAVAPPPPPPPIPPARFAGLHVSAQTVTVSRTGVAKISVSCPAGTNGSCAGTLTLKTAKAVQVSAAKKRKPKRKVLTLGHAKFTVAAGKSAKIRVKLSKRAFKLLKARHSLKTKATVVSHDAAAATVTAKVNVKLKAPKARHKRHHR